MNDQDERNKRKTKLIYFTLIAIITILFIGIIYQFVVIKKLEAKQNQNNSSSYIIVETNDDIYLQ